MFALYHHDPSRPRLVLMLAAENMPEAISRAVKILLEIALQQYCEQLETECHQHIQNHGFSVNVQYEEELPEVWSSWPGQIIEKFLWKLAPDAGLTCNHFEWEEGATRIDLDFFQRYLESPESVRSELEVKPSGDQVRSIVRSRKRTTISFDKSPGVEMPEGFWARGPKIGVEDRILGNIHRGRWSFPEPSTATPEDWDRFQQFLVSQPFRSFKWESLPMPSQQYSISIDSTPFRLEFPSYVLSTPEGSIGFWSLKDEKLHLTVEESNPLVRVFKVCTPEAEIVEKDFEPSKEESESDLSISEKQKETSHSDVSPVHSTEED